MHSKTWTELELRKRDEIAESASQSIANSKNPQQMANSEMPRLIKYEILPNIVWDRMSDNDIREFAKSKISPARSLNKAPDFGHYNKFPELTVAQCVKLMLNIDPKSAIRTQAEKERFDRVFEVAASYRNARKAPFSHDHPGDDAEYSISPYAFLTWAESQGEGIPEKWQPVDMPPKQSERATPEIHEPRYEEAVNAAILMLEEGSAPLHISNDLILRIRMSPEDFPACRFCSSDDSLLRSIRKGGGNPLEDPRYLAALRDFRE